MPDALELVGVEDPELEKRTEAEADPDADGDGDDEDEEGEPTADKAGEKPEDKRAGHAEGESEGEDPRTTANRQRRHAKQERQRKQRERNERELNFLRGRNEKLERQFSQLESRQRKTEVLSIDQQLKELNQQIAEAKEVEAAAISAQAGEDAVEAREIREGLERRFDQLTANKTNIAKAPAAESGGGEREMPPHVALAVDWIKRNPWYKADGSTEESAIAQAVETSLLRQGLRPDTEEYWEKLDERLQKRIPDVFKKTKKMADVDADEEDDTTEDPPERGAPRKEPTPPAKRSSGGPKVSVGGASRNLRANEVYVSPARKEAMVEAGVWDDPILRQRYLAQYQKYDRENA